MLNDNWVFAVIALITVNRLFYGIYSHKQYKEKRTFRFTMHSMLHFCKYWFRGDNMDTKTKEQMKEQENHDKFNSITQKTTPENQNQTHNSRKEGIQPINQKR